MFFERDIDNLNCFAYNLKEIFGIGFVLLNIG